MVKVIDLVSLLVSQEGDKYVFGVEASMSDANPSAFDCSELIEWGCARLHVTPKMPDGSWIQYQHCKKHGSEISVEKASITAGALLFRFSDNPNTNQRPKNAHVAMSLGNGMTIEARGKDYGVGIFSVENRKWTHAALIPGVDTNFEQPSSNSGGNNMTRKFVACKHEVKNRGVPPDDFLNSLIDWAHDAPDEIFEKNQHHDIYSNVVVELGPWKSLLHRKAVMLEVLRVLGGFESSWDWNEDVDKNNPHSNKPCTKEAGIFQCSGDSMSFDSSLKNLLHQVSGKTDCDTFRETTKSNHKFAIEYCARLIRFTTDHHGPIKRKEINEWLRQDAVIEFESFLSE